MPRLSPHMVAHVESSFSRRRPTMVPHGQVRRVHSPSARLPALRIRRARSLRLVAQPKSLSCSRSHEPVARHMSSSCARLVISGCPDIESVHDLAQSQSFLRGARLRISVSRILRSALFRPVSQTKKRASAKDPEAMKPDRPRGCPRDRPNLTARVAHTMEPISRPSCPGRKTDLMHRSPAP